MEVAGHSGQWRREWAGTAEYGKVTEGGVTRHVARAMEVLNASAPGTRVRVMRAAYHSSGGPGLPASSYLMHSSRRVISSGFNLLESPTTPSKPLEISSMPLESSPEYNTDTENYKVTEPDDYEISEPSKWKSAPEGKIQMPSEESSSTDNASIIDLDSRPPRSMFRKHSYDSESSDVSMSRRNSSRMSPLLEPPATLSTLKYKSLLNGSNDWTNRRKSYSFEDTSPTTETIIHSNDTLAMESSTDSGICKSTEIVNEPDDKCSDGNDRKYYDRHQDTFQDWLSKNRPTTSFYKGHHLTPRREHNVVIEEPAENIIALQSKGKVTITVPITVETDEEYHQRKNLTTEDGERKIKKVGFCKTELHFAAESGKVNIIATDEKPPPSSDFRKRRSAFVPIHSSFDKPITLFGDSIKDFAERKPIELMNSETVESDENTAATKSILKNKIPKPKPYLLGENMVIGGTKDDDVHFGNEVPTAVSLINRQLQERRHSNDTISSDTDLDVRNKAYRTSNKGPQDDTSKLSRARIEFEGNHFGSYNRETNSIKNKLLQLSPVPVRARTRQLRESDLTYFGVDRSPKQSSEDKIQQLRLQPENNNDDDVFQSVKLIQKISNSVCNSEAESEETPEYQNIPIKTNFAPIPTPRTKSIFERNSNIRILRPVIEHADEIRVQGTESRRSRLRRQDDSLAFSSRSISAPAKPIYTSSERPRKLELQPTEKRSPSPRSRRSHVTASSKNNRSTTTKTIRDNCELVEENEPLYINLNRDDKSDKHYLQKTDSFRRKSEKQRKIQNERGDTSNIKRLETRKTSGQTRDKKEENLISETVQPASHVDTSARLNESSLNKQENSTQKTTRVRRTEKLSTPDYSKDKIYNTRRRTSSERTDDHNNTHTTIPEHRSRSSQRHSKDKSKRIYDDDHKHGEENEPKHHTIIEQRENEAKYRTEKVSTSDPSQEKIYSTRRRSSSERTDDHNNTPKTKPEHRSRSSQRHSKGKSKRTSDDNHKHGEEKGVKHHTIIEDREKDAKHRTEKVSTPDYSKDKILSTRRRSSSERTDDDNNTLKTKPEHRSRSSQRHSKDKNNRFFVDNSKHGEEKESKHPTIIEEREKDAKYRTASQNRISSKKEHIPKTPQTDEINHYSINSRGKDKIIMEKVPPACKHDSKGSKRSEYVINYDDKNGTVSSICKVAGSTTSSKKKAIKEKASNSPKEYHTKKAAPERLALRK